MTTIYQGRAGDPNYYLRPVSRDPMNHKMAQRNVYYVFNGTCKLLGEGAMGKVYLVHAYGNNHDMAACKRVSQTYQNIPKIRLRARQEATMAFLHPNLIEMLGYCEFHEDHGPLLILSRYFNGINIDKYLKRTQPDDRVEVVCGMMRQVLSALGYLHSLGITHRDIKPSNIMVDDNRHVKLMDLGIAHVEGGNKFSTIGVIGTPEYLPPEQIRYTEGDLATIGPYSDLYSLGITFYELLAGINPFRGQSQADTLQRQQTMKLPSNPFIPKPLMRVLWKATEKKPEDRFQNADDFDEAIVKALSKANNGGFWHKLKSLLDSAKGWFYK